MIAQLEDNGVACCSRNGECALSGLHKLATLEVVNAHAFNVSTFEGHRAAFDREERRIFCDLPDARGLVAAVDVEHYYGTLTSRDSSGVAVCASGLLCAVDVAVGLTDAGILHSASLSLHIRHR